MKSISQQLIESFQHIFEEPINATGYDPAKVQYAYQGGKANPNYPGAQSDTPGPDTSSYTDPRGTTNVSNDPKTSTDSNKTKPQKSKLFDPNVQGIQNLFNKLGVTDNAGNKINPDGVWGWRTEEAKHNFYKKYKKGSAEERELQSYADKVAPQFQWRIIADRDGRTARGGADMSKPKDPAIGEPSAKALAAMGLDVSGKGEQSAIPQDSKGKALAISRAISGPGTDEDAVYAVLDSVKNIEEFNQIAAAYKAAWGGRRELGAELLGDFSGIDLVQLNARLKKLGLTLAADGQITPIAKTTESTELDTIKFLSGLK